MKEKVVYQGGDKQHSEHFNRIFSIVVDPQNTNVFYSGGWDKMILTHDIREPHSVSHFMGPYLSGDSLDICDTTLLAGSYRSRDPIQLYDITSGGLLEEYQWQEDTDKNGGMIISSQFGHPKTDAIIAGSSTKKEVKILDSKDGSVLTEITDFNGPVVALQLDYQGKTLAIGTKSGGVVLLHYGEDVTEK